MRRRVFRPEFVEGYRRGTPEMLLSISWGTLHRMGDRAFYGLGACDDGLPAPSENSGLKTRSIFKLVNEE